MELIKEIVVILLFAVVVAVFLKMVLNSIKSLSERAKSPVRSHTAEVIAKRSETGLGEFKADGLRYGKGGFEVEFLTDEGETVVLEMSKTEFDMLTEGARGILSFRGKTYLGFTPDSLI